MLENVMFLEENTGRMLSDINQSNIFFNPLPRVLKIKTKISKQSLIKFKSFCTAKEIIKKKKKKLKMGENICK